jgi:hypothetical protein
VRDAHYVYAIVRQGAELPTRTMRGVAELSMVSYRELVAVTGSIGSDPASPTMEAMLHHEAVVEAVRAAHPALPVRFGTAFRDAPSIATALAQRYETLLADLDRLGDKVELSLTALWSARASHRARHVSPLKEHARRGDGVGARYLRARAASLRRDEGLKERARLAAQRIDKVLCDHALERRVFVHPTPRIALRMTYLLTPMHVDRFRSAFDALRGDRRELRLLLTGPWPPYSFVKRAEIDGQADPARRLAELAPVLVRREAEARRPRRRGAQANK